MKLYISWQFSSIHLPPLLNAAQLWYSASPGFPLSQLVNHTPAGSDKRGWGRTSTFASDHLQDAVSARSPIQAMGHCIVLFNSDRSSAFRTTARSVWSFWQRSRAAAKVTFSKWKVKSRAHDAARKSPVGSAGSSRVISFLLTSASSYEAHNAPTRHFFLHYMLILDATLKIQMIFLLRGATVSPTNFI